MNKFRIFFAINLVLVIIFKIILPGYKELRREKQVTKNDINKYKSNSTLITLKNYERLNAGKKNEVYFDGTPFIKKYSTKKIGYIKDLENQKIYKIELYSPQSILMTDIAENNDKILLLVNKDEFKKRGSLNEPIIALRYTINSDMENHVPHEEYDFNVKEYLTYKNYTPPNTKSISYYLIMIWVFFTIAGFSITTGILIKKGFINKEGKFNPQGKTMSK